MKKRRRNLGAVRWYVQLDAYQRLKDENVYNIKAFSQQANESNFCEVILFTTMLLAKYFNMPPLNIFIYDSMQFYFIYHR